VWPPILVAGVAFAVPQYLVSNYHGPWLVNVVAAISSMSFLALFLKVWHPANPMLEMPTSQSGVPTVSPTHDVEVTPPSAVRRAWTPWIILAVFVFLWGTPQVRAWLDAIWVQKMPIAGLHELVQRVPPVVTAPHAEAAVYNFNILSATGTGIFFAAILSGLFLGYSVSGLVAAYARTIYLVRFSLMTIACMMAIGFVTRYAGTDATLGLALANTGHFYPFFGALIGWLGVALTGSDTSSNVLFGGLQKITAEQLGINPLLMAAANSSGGVMGKMIDAQSIVVASTATKWYGHEGSILRFVFFHSVALASLVGLLVMGQVYFWH
jgi:lactate permease